MGKYLFVLLILFICVATYFAIRNSISRKKRNLTIEDLDRLDSDQIIDKYSSFLYKINLNETKINIDTIYDSIKESEFIGKFRIFKVKKINQNYITL